MRNKEFLPLFIFFFFLFSFFSCKTKPSIILEEEIINVVQPEFEIVSILIYQGDLVNTLFETVLKITNPNQFEINVSNIKYELHGNEMLWADGTVSNIVSIPANQSVETKFSFSMNFINMNRKLLDDVISMRQVSYKFKGEAQIKTDIPNAPDFIMEFDISGLSDVIPR